MTWINQYIDNALHRMIPMFLKTAQHPIHYVVGSITQFPTVIKAWELEPFAYKMQWLFLYALTFFMLTASVGGLEVGVFMALSCLVMVGATAGPTIMASPKSTPFLLRFSDAYANAILPWHAFFVSMYLLQMMGLGLSALSGSWTLASSMTVLTCIVAMFCAFALQMAVSLTGRLPQWVVPVGSATMAYAMKLFSGFGG